MNSEFIEKYIDLLTPKHILEYAKSNQIYVSTDESMILCSFLKKNYKELLQNDSKLIELKPIIRPELYKEIVLLYQKKKTKYF
ncbi:MAG: DUF2624 family protein [Bacilli bacterium]|nr:DUF2624 family protein [Bacilli bacterium]